jgi:hypothetical protein
LEVVPHHDDIAGTFFLARAGNRFNVEIRFLIEKGETQSQCVAELPGGRFMSPETRRKNQTRENHEKTSFTSVNSDRTGFRSSKTS